MRVLIVDRRPEFRRVAGELLTARGYAVAGESATPAAALEAAALHVPDAVLLAVRLGEQSGFDLCSQLMRHDPSPAVLLTPSDDYGQCVDALRRSGARGFVLKSQLATTDFARYWPDTER